MKHVVNIKLCPRSYTRELLLKLLLVAEAVRSLSIPGDITSPHLYLHYLWLHRSHMRLASTRRTSSIAACAPRWRMAGGSLPDDGGSQESSALVNLVRAPIDHAPHVHVIQTRS